MLHLGGTIVAMVLKDHLKKKYRNYTSVTDAYALFRGENNGRPSAR